MEAEHRAVAESLEVGRGTLFTFIAAASDWRSSRTTNVIERCTRNSKRRIKTQTVPPSAEMAAMSFWRRPLQGRSTCAKWMVGRPSPESPSIRPIDLAA